MEMAVTGPARLPINRPDPSILILFEYSIAILCILFREVNDQMLFTTRLHVWLWFAIVTDVLSTADS